MSRSEMVKEWMRAAAPVSLDKWAPGMRVTNRYAPDAFGPGTVVKAYMFRNELILSVQYDSDATVWQGSASAFVRIYVPELRKAAQLVRCSRCEACGSVVVRRASGWFGLVGVTGTFRMSDRYCPSRGDRHVVDGSDGSPGGEGRLVGPDGRLVFGEW